MSWRVLVTARAFWSAAQEGQQALREAGCTLVGGPELGRVTAEQLLPLLHGCDACIASMEAYDAGVFAAVPDLKVVSRCGVGYDAIDVPAATAAGVAVTNTPGAMVDAVADFTVGLILACARRIPEIDAAVHAGGWGEYTGTLVCGKTLGLIGYGQIGRAVAERMRGFQMRVLVYDPHLPCSPEPDASSVSLDQLLAESDFISLHAPSTPATSRMLGAREFGLMKPTAFFVNTSRGALVDETALIEALTSERLAGAALDVTQQEPLPSDHALRRVPRTILTSHNAFNAREAAKRMCNMAADNVLALLHGRRPEATLNPEVYGSPVCRLAVQQGEA